MVPSHPRFVFTRSLHLAVALAVLLVPLLTLLPLDSAFAATRTVTNTADSGPGSLRQAIADAAPGDTITFASNVIGTITLTTGELAISKNLTIQGLGARLLTVDGNNSSRVFNISGGVVAISGLTISNGLASTDPRGGGIFNAGVLTLSESVVSRNQVVVASANDEADGGGIYNSGGTLHLVNSTVSGNLAQNNGSRAQSAGGGIENFSGTVTISNSTISGNRAVTTVIGNSFPFALGGGIVNFGSSTTTIVNATITANEATSPGDGRGGSGGNGGGIYIGNGTVSVKNTIVAGNTASTRDADITGVVVDAGNNILSGDPLLGPLIDNGGQTPTHALLSGSPAIDTGSSNGCPATDQRGVARPQGTACDIGAFESPFTATPTPTNTATVTSTSTQTSTPTATSTSTRTSTATATAPATATATATNTPTNTPVLPTNTATNTPTTTPSNTPTASGTSTSTPTDTAVPTDTATPSSTATVTNTPSNTPTKTSTPTNTPVTPLTIAVGPGGVCLTDFTGQVPFRVSNASASVSATSSNTTLLPVSAITFSGSGTNRVLTVAPVAGKSGSATIMLKVSDGAGTTSITMKVLVGTSSSDSLTASSGPDIMFGGNGNDTLQGGGGNDLLCGGAGDDKLYGSDGYDTLDGGAGNDTLYGQDNDDTLLGGPGNDNLQGGDGIDVLRGGDGDDKLDGGANNDQLYGEGDNDTLTGGSGTDSFDGGAGTDKATDYDRSKGETQVNIP